jgi:3-oxoacyl-[acyl-carrier protein] reductase
MLDKKVCFVTGTATGIGSSIAELYSAHGAIVYGMDINPEVLGGPAKHSFVGDVRRPADIKAVVADAIQRYGRIDVLVNNAGIYPRKAFVDMTEAEWDEVVDVNLKGVFYCTKLVLPHMIAGRGGKIVNIASVNVFKGGALLSHYTAAKCGVVGLTRSLSREVGPDNIYVNCVTPGAVEVPIEKLVSTPEEIAALVAQQSIQRRIVPIDIARVCLFLSCELSDGMTGQIVNVDGGRILH